MKKIILFSTIVLIGQTNIKAQGQGSGGSSNATIQWKTTGNTAQTTDFIGTTNPQSLILKSNNVQALEIKPTGDLYFNHLPSSNGDGIVKIGGGGGVGRIDFTHNFTHVLNGQGIFTDISTFTGLKVSGTNIIQTTSGNIGIGVATPMSKLSVAGDGSFTGALSSTTLDLTQRLTFNGGQNGIGYIPAVGNNPGIIYIGKQQPPSTLSTPCNIPTGGISGTLFANNGAIASYGFNNNLTNIGYAILNYDGANGLIEAGGSNSSGTPNLLLNYYCGSNVDICTGGFGTNPMNTGGANGKGGVVSVGQNFQIGGPIFDLNSALNVRVNAPQTIAINVQDNGYTPVFKVASNGNTAIGANNNVGYATTKMLNVNGDVCLANYGPSAGVHANDGFSGIEILGNGGVPVRRGMSVDADPNGDFNFYINGAQNTVANPAEFNFKNGGAGSSFNTVVNLMTLNANGQLFLGTKKQDGTQTGNHASSLLQVYGDMVVGTSGAANVWVTIDHWADFVFDKNYKLMPLNELEIFYQQNHHLPNVPTTKEIQEDGDNLAQTDVILLQKIEENTLYIVELKKQLEEQKKQFEAQQKIIEELAKKLTEKK